MFWIPLLINARKAKIKYYSEKSFIWNSTISNKEYVSQKTLCMYWREIETSHVALEEMNALLIILLSI